MVRGVGGRPGGGGDEVCFSLIYRLWEGRKARELVADLTWDGIGESSCIVPGL